MSTVYASQCKYPFYVTDQSKTCSIKAITCLKNNYSFNTHGHILMETVLYMDLTNYYF